MQKLPIAIIEDITKYLEFEQVFNLPFINTDIIKYIYKRDKNTMLKFAMDPIFLIYYNTVFRYDNLNACKLLIEAGIKFDSGLLSGLLYGRHTMLQYTKLYNSTTITKYILENNIDVA